MARHIFLLRNLDVSGMRSLATSLASHSIMSAASIPLRVTVTTFSKQSMLRPNSLQPLECMTSGYELWEARISSPWYRSSRSNAPKEKLGDRLTMNCHAMALASPRRTDEEEIRTAGPHSICTFTPGSIVSNCPQISSFETTAC